MHATDNHIRRWRTGAACLVWALAMPAVAGAAGSDSEWVIARSSTNESAQGLRTIELHNAHGNIRVRGAGEPTLELISVVQRHAEDPWRPEIRRQRLGDRLVLEVVDPDAPRAKNPDEAPGQDRRRVDLSGFVPDSLTLVLHTRDGFVESKGHKGALQVRTETGDIKLKTTGVVEASTARGAIQSVHQGGRWPGDSSYFSETGDTVIWLSEQASVEARVRTEGFITTDFSITIKHQPGSTRKIGRAAIGAPAQTLDVESINGNITLARRINMLRSARP